MAEGHTHGDKMSYQYPDKADLITLSLVLMKNGNDELLRKAEDILLARAISMFRQNRYTTLLDLGCGNGRLTIELSKYFQWVTALEPDGERLAEARKKIADNGIENVSFVHSLFQDAGLPDDYFDVVICNQILQHVNTRAVEPIIREVHRVLKSRGVLVMTTSFAKGDEDCYWKVFAAEGKVQAVEITPQEFDGLASGDPGILPVHFFSSVSLEMHLQSFRPIEQSIHDNIYPHPLLDTILYIGEKRVKQSLGGATSFI